MGRERSELAREVAVKGMRWFENGSSVCTARIFAWMIVSLLLCGASAASAQDRKTLEITPMVGWQYGGSIDAAQGGDLHFNAGWNYGGSLGIQMEPNLTGEVSWSVQKSKAVLQPAGLLPDTTLFDLDIHYFQLAGLRDLGEGSVRPFVLGSVGATMFDPKASGFDSHWFFSLGVGLGVRAPLSERMGLRVQGRFLLPMQFDSGSIFCGSGGCGGSVSGGTAIPQGDVSAGLSVKL